MTARRIPTTSTTQNVQGFYDAVGGATPGEIATLYNSGGNWNGTPSSVPIAAAREQYSLNLNSDTAYAAVIFSTPVTNSDNDGILDAWKSGPRRPRFLCRTARLLRRQDAIVGGVAGRTHGEKDLFVQLDYMCGNVLSNTVRLQRGEFVADA